MLASSLSREVRRAGIPLDSLTPLGSLRRYAPDIGDVSLFGVAPPAQHQHILDALAALPSTTDVTTRDQSSITVATHRGPARVLLSAPETAGSRLLWLTGSRAHVELLRQRADRLGVAFGPDVPAGTEDEIYRSLRLPFIPPELREGADEIDAAERHALPALVMVSHIRGDLHMHSTWSDGRDTIEGMMAASQQLGYEYVALTDHSERAGASRTLHADSIDAQRRELDGVRRQFPKLDILHGVEVDIMPDGTLDFDNELLAGFDIVLASLHDHAGQGPAELLDRYLRAIDNPFVSIITHPANRSPANSAGYEIDYDALFAAAAATGTALEIDGAPGHLDMDGLLARRALAAGVTLVIDSDCHRSEALARQMRFGVGTARRGWVEPRHVLNTRSAADVRAFVARKRAHI